MIVEFVYSKVYCKVLLRKEKLDLEILNRIDFQKRMGKIRNEWKKHERKILNEISRLTNLKWQESKVKCYLVTRTIPFSEPLTIPVYKEIDRFIDVLIHELIHQIFMQGKNYELSKEAWEYFLGKYKDESWRTKIHIPLHAIHSHIYLKFFSEERMQRDIDAVREFDNESYNRSWEIVQKEGYENLIKEFSGIVKR
jgi:hypothetical protein